MIQTEVGVNAWGLSYNTDLYGADVLEFRPERWFERSVGTTTSSISQFAVSSKWLCSLFIPLLSVADIISFNHGQFGGGSRTCIGKNISLLEMNKVIPQLVRKFDISVDPKTYPWGLVTHWFVKQYYDCIVRSRGGADAEKG